MTEGTWFMHCGHVAASGTGAFTTHALPDKELFLVFDSVAGKQVTVTHVASCEGCSITGNAASDLISNKATQGHHQVGRER